VRWQGGDDDGNDADVYALQSTEELKRYYSPCYVVLPRHDERDQGMTMPAQMYEMQTRAWLVETPIKGGITSDSRWSESTAMSPSQWAAQPGPSPPGPKEQDHLSMPPKSPPSMKSHPVCFRGGSDELACFSTDR
jgi:hypothetical protein